MIEGITVLGTLLSGAASGVSIYKEYFKERRRQWKAELVTVGTDPAIELAVDRLHASGIPEDELDKPVYMRRWIDETFRPSSGHSQPARPQDHLIVSWCLSSPEAEPTIGSVLWATKYEELGYLFISGLGCGYRDANDRRADDPWMHPSLGALYSRAESVLQPASLKAVVFESEFPRRSSSRPTETDRADDVVRRLFSFRSRLQALKMPSCRLPISYCQPNTDPRSDSNEALPLLLCAASSAWVATATGEIELRVLDVLEIVEFVYDYLYLDAFEKQNDSVTEDEILRYRVQLAKLKERALAELPGLSTERSVNSLVPVLARPLIR
jgi:hypothetical protein